VGVRWLGQAGEQGQGKRRLSCRFLFGLANQIAASIRLQGMAPSESVMEWCSRREQQPLRVASLRPKQEKKEAGSISNVALGQINWSQGASGTSGDSGVAAGWYQGSGRKGCRQIRMVVIRLRLAGGVRGTRSSRRGRLLESTEKN